MVANYRSGATLCTNSHSFGKFLRKFKEISLKFHILSGVLGPHSHEHGSAPGGALLYLADSHISDFDLCVRFEREEKRTNPVKEFLKNKVTLSLPLSL